MTTVTRDLVDASWERLCVLRAAHRPIPEGWLERHDLLLGAYLRSTEERGTDDPTFAAVWEPDVEPEWVSEYEADVEPRWVADDPEPQLDKQLEQALHLADLAFGNTSPVYDPALEMREQLMARAARGERMLKDAWRAYKQDGAPKPPYAKWRRKIDALREEAKLWPRTTSAFTYEQPIIRDSERATSQGDEDESREFVTAETLEEFADQNGMEIVDALHLLHTENERSGETGDRLAGTSLGSYSVPDDLAEHSYEAFQAARLQRRINSRRILDSIRSRGGFAKVEQALLYGELDDEYGLLVDHIIECWDAISRHEMNERLTEIGHLLMPPAPDEDEPRLGETALAHVTKVMDLLDEQRQLAHRLKTHWAPVETRKDASLRPGLLRPDPVHPEHRSFLPEKPDTTPGIPDYAPLTPEEHWRRVLERHAEVAIQAYLMRAHASG